jgi:hypothetical protein
MRTRVCKWVCSGSVQQQMIGASAQAVSTRLVVAALALVLVGSCNSDMLARVNKHTVMVDATAVERRACTTAGRQVHRHNGLGMGKRAQLEGALVGSLESAGGPW